ncbi:glycolipid anchored surface protein [Thozetella sp. PMI_491]|nr:glycolipid anchored surface protein [Thozetella sp. PMI_491]
MGHLRALAGLLLAASGTVKAVVPITAKGQYLFTPNGTQFFIRGVAYQQGVGVGGQVDPGTQSFIDPLADATSCKRDIPLLQQLNTNTIRVYAVDPTADHSECMTALDAAGIYVIADLGAPADGDSINRDTPAWNTALFDRYKGVIDNLATFPNTLGFFAGNEVTNNNTNSKASAYVKAAVRDSKAYITSKNVGRWIGVGYATNDDAGTRDLLADYFNCGDQAAAVDFWGYNIYEWCGESTFETSGYKERTDAFRNFSVPAFFSEYGCNNPGGGEARIFQETPVLYSSQMNTVWSGGIVYEFFQEQNDFGLVSVSGGQVSPRKEFTVLAKQLATVTASASTNQTQRMNTYTPTNVARDCPKVVAGNWEAASALPPTPNATVCDCMVQSLQCVMSTSVKAESMGSIFGTVCGLDAKACDGIASNATTGTYGAFSMCSGAQQLNHVLNQYYVNQGKSKSACDFGGQAQLLSSAQSLNSTCTAVLQQTSTSGTGTSSSSGGSSSSGSTSGGSGGSTNGNGACFNT